MKNLLQINASIFGENGQSRRLADQFVTGWRAANHGATVTVRDVTGEPVPHLTGERFSALIGKPEERDAQQQAVVDYSDALIEELKRADVILLGLPMYNFGIPSTLKAYFDHVARAGVTFRYTENGPIGLLTGKKVYVFAARGGIYQGTQGDIPTAYVRQILGFIGLTDVEFVYAEGLAMGEESKQAGVAKAEAATGQLIADLRAAA
ncbi:MAG: FMN-dependent NADH-azoreductase [Noviherbaspirillum sp.]|nr:FMN-dependent NADH-azoreductase [Noviherbaspirillum sp.]